jgi:hypothetical protein
VIAILAAMAATALICRAARASEKFVILSVAATAEVVIGPSANVKNRSKRNMCTFRPGRLVDTERFRKYGKATSGMGDKPVFRAQDFPAAANSIAV